MGESRLREFVLTVGREGCAESAGVVAVRIPPNEPSVLESADEKVG